MSFIVEAVAHNYLRLCTCPLIDVAVPYGRRPALPRTLKAKGNIEHNPKSRSVEFLASAASIVIYGLKSSDFDLLSPNEFFCFLFRRGFRVGAGDARLCFDASE